MKEISKLTTSSDLLPKLAGDKLAYNGRHNSGSLSQCIEKKRQQIELSVIAHSKQLLILHRIHVKLY